MKKAECIVCKNELEDMTDKPNSFHPMDGLEFVTGGVDTTVQPYLIQ